jgi:hypothetical protein
MDALIDRSGNTTTISNGAWDITSILAQFDFNDHSNKQGQIVWINATFISLIGLVVTMRIFTRFFIVRHIFLDDGKLVHTTKSQR